MENIKVKLLKRITTAYGNILNYFFFSKIEFLQLQVFKSVNRKKSWLERKIDKLSNENETAELVSLNKIQPFKVFLE